MMTTTITIMLIMLMMMATCRLKPAGGARGPLRAGALARGMPKPNPNPKPLWWRAGSAVVGSSVTAGSRPPWAPRAWRVPGGWELRAHRPGVPAGTWPVPFFDELWVATWAPNAPPPPEGTLAWMRTERDACGVLRALVLEWDEPTAARQAVGSPRV